MPVTSDLDIYRSANKLIEQHGKDAPIHAAMRADELMEAGDMDGRAVWLRILAAIDELRWRGATGAAARRLHRDQFTRDLSMTGEAAFHPVFEALAESCP